MNRSYFSGLLLLLLVFSGKAFSGIASCPGTTVATLTGLGSFVHSDCGITISGNQRWVGLAYRSGDMGIGTGFGGSGGISPSPSGFLGLGTTDLGSQSYLVQGMGASYAGDCSEVAYTVDPMPVSVVPAVDGNVYCARLQTNDSPPAFFRGTWNATGMVFTDPNSVYAVSSSSPVPTLPAWGLFVLAGLLGLIGVRKRFSNK